AEGQWTLEIQDLPSQVRNPEKQGKLKEWSLILYGTVEHPYHTFSAHQSRSRMLELSAPELEPPKAALSPSQVEVPEDEEDYTAQSTPGSANILQTRDIWQRLETFWVVTTGRMYSHPVGGGQEYC
ncbi:PCSK6 isoform 2, partial [Pan troglodytes]